MKQSLPKAAPGFTLVEVMVSMTIAVITLSLAMGIFVYGLKIMYRDVERLKTNGTLRFFVAQVSKETLDATEFYIFRNYEDLDGSVTIDPATMARTSVNADGITVYHGDCLVLVSRVGLADTATIRQFRIYYRRPDPTDASKMQIRYWESPTLPVTGSESTASITSLLDKVDLKANPDYIGSGRASIMAGRTVGRPILDGDGKPTAERYEIFSSEYPKLDGKKNSVSINVEVVNGTTVNNLLSSSSFNYTISPRR